MQATFNRRGCLDWSKCPQAATQLLPQWVLMSPSLLVIGRSSPKDLPPTPPLPITGDLLMLHSETDRAIGRLDAATQLLPNPDLFVAMYVRREAVYSSQIEGTQASLTDLLEYEADAATKGLPADVNEVVNYVAALNFGLDRLKDLPLSLRLIKEIHAKLLEGVRGGRVEPGEFRPHRQSASLAPESPLRLVSRKAGPGSRCCTPSSPAHSPSARSAKRVR